MTIKELQTKFEGIKLSLTEMTEDFLKTQESFLPLLENGENAKIYGSGEECDKDKLLSDIEISKSLIKNLGELTFEDFIETYITEECVFMALDKSGEIFGGNEND